MSVLELMAGLESRQVDQFALLDGVRNNMLSILYQNWYIRWK